MNKCHLCGSENLILHQAFSSLKRVSSDCQPWSSGGSLATCQNCYSVIKPIDKNWINECDKIYENYSVYDIANGNEQSVFDANNGQGAERSSVLLNNILKNNKLNKEGVLLDFGCGNGAFIKAAISQLPGWEFDGLEHNTIYKESVSCLERVNQFFTSLDQSHKKYNMISLIHVLEHIQSPNDLLISLSEKLESDGLLFIQVPYFMENPFDLLITDHCTHFSPQSLSALIEKNNYEIINLSTNWISKEISLVAKKIKNTKNSNFIQVDPNVTLLINWLCKLESWGNNSVTEFESVGIFGTAIAGTWMHSLLKNKIKFFVDEDLNKSDQEYMNCPIILPNKLTNKNKVLLSLAPTIAHKIYQRLDKYRDNLILPPTL